ncbi:PREDICTED: uncharacterized protein LOC106752137 [Dinoponera quadriceps]|uniref:Uncharacterized protein LOC106752137 n=1 Tax=Dinoponera quadriceps TaxID=609295 RepID=A0A6P3YGS1_DINQU|nr:PREDICTED: uncharacterized protein LOC106752137 [Dinoponera quadriceps]
MVVTLNCGKQIAVARKQNCESSSSAITYITSLSTDAGHDEPIVKVYKDNCECIEFDCGCCQHIEWDAVSLNGTLCANASYLEYEYGISITVTYNDFTIINETVSARNPPPICVGEDIVDAIQIDVCFRIYDIDIGPDKFHACFEILAKFMHIINTPSIKLGCITTKLQKQLEYIDNRVFHVLQSHGGKT